VPTHEILDVGIQERCSTLHRLTVVAIVPELRRRIPDEWVQSVGVHRGGSPACDESRSFISRYKMTEGTTGKIDTGLEFDEIVAPQRDD